MWKKMKLRTDKIVLKKQLFDGYAAFYKADTIHKFADNIQYIVYHGDIATKIDKFITIQSMVDTSLLEVEYLEKANKLVIDTTC